MNRSILCCGLLLLAGTVGAQPPQRQPREREADLPRGIKAHRNVPYVTDGHPRQVLDVYTPEQRSGSPRPLIVWIHGGGWQSGSKENCPPLRAGYVEQGYVLASLNYRLSGDATFPAQIEDCKSAIRWLRAHAADYNIDPDRIGVWGSSAGGHLVALLGTSGDVAEFDVGSHLNISSRVQAVCDFFGPTDFTAFVKSKGYESHANADSPESKLIGGLVLEHPEKAAKANPITYVTPDDPPFLIVHGDSDPLVPLNQSELLFEALKGAGTRVHLHTIQGAGHGGAGFTADKVQGMIRTFFERRLKGTEPVEKVATTSTSSVRPDEAGANNRPRPTFDQVLERSDKDGDGRISREEFRAAGELFDRLDADNDGFITREEHVRLFSTRRP